MSACEGLLCAASVAPLLEENARLQAQVTALQARMTEMAEASLTRRVGAFMRMKEQATPTSPCVPANDIVRLRLRLVAEEFFELLEATLGQWTSRPWVLSEAKERTKLAVDNCQVNVDMPEVADALADIDYVVEGMRLAFGIHGEPIARVVHESNMAKSGGPLRADGKAMKPEGWKPPDIAGALKRQGWMP